MSHIAPQIELTPRQTMTLMQIANGWDGAGEISEPDVSHLQSLGLIEQRGTSIGLTASGRQRIVRLRRV